MNQTAYHTATRDDIIDLSATFARAARWKHIENTDGYTNGKPATVSFVNARLDFINAQLAHALNTRSFREGFLFATNLPRFTIGKLLTGAQFPSPSMKINIRFAEGEPRPHQLGPFKWGPHGPIGNRVITCEGP